METGKKKEEKEHAHKMLQKRVDKCIEKGHNVIMMGDYNTPLNDRENQPKNVATEKLLEWEETGNIRILNDKEIPTRVTGEKNGRANCIYFILFRIHSQDTCLNNI